MRVSLGGPSAGPEPAHVPHRHKHGSTVPQERAHDQHPSRMGEPDFTFRGAIDGCLSASLPGARTGCSPAPGAAIVPLVRLNEVGFQSRKRVVVVQNAPPEGIVSLRERFRVPTQVRTSAG